MSDPIEELKNAEFNIHDVEDIPTIFRLSLESIEFLASRLTDLERMVADYKIAVDAVTDWVDKRDKEMYEKALPDLEDEPARAEIVERYAWRVKDECLPGIAVSISFMSQLRTILSDLITEVTK